MFILEKKYSACNLKVGGSWSNHGASLGLDFCLGYLVVRETLEPPTM